MPGTLMGEANPSRFDATFVFLGKDGILIQVVWQLLTLDPLVQPERLCVGRQRPRCHCSRLKARDSA